MLNIESILTERRKFAPSPEFVRQANIGPDQHQALLEWATRDYEGFWAEHARREISWHRPFTRVLDETRAPFYTWFEDGLLNASYNCLDRHLPERADKTAIIFETDDGRVERISYQALYHRVCQFANGLKAQGVGLGDRVIIYMPMSIEAVVAMQACARIGAIHSVVFGGFSAKSLNERIIDASAKLIVTADQGIRGGKIIELKQTVDQALEMGGCDCVERVVIYRRTGQGLPLQGEREIWLHDMLAGQPDTCEPTWVSAEHPLFILYTSGSTGKPKGVQHSTGGYLLGAALTMRWVFDYKADDVYWCTADVGWITGHTYVAYGPTAVGATQVIFEGIPTYPDTNRFWRMIEAHRVSVFYTAPTAIRSLIKATATLPISQDLSSLRLLGTVGEPINPEAWMWYYETIGGSRCPIVDTWWQTETGSHMIAPLPGVVAGKPGSCSVPLPGIMVDIVDEDGGTVPGNSGGMLVIKRPFPSQLRTLWNDPERFQNTYFPEMFGGKYYLAGDSAHRDEDDYVWIMGRIDDVLNVSGHRLGTMEIESALVAHPLVAEAAIVGRPHEIKGEAVVAFVVLKGQRPEGEEAQRIAGELGSWVAKQIGAIARPDDIRFGDNLPKTRSGKIMRRLLRSIARSEEITSDVSTLENPAILEQLKQNIS